MKSSQLESRTVRPGFNNYSFYYSKRRPASVQEPSKRSVIKKRPLLLLIVALTLLIAGIIAAPHIKAALRPVAKVQTAKQVAKATTLHSAAKPPAASVAAPPPLNQCATNALAQLALVSVSQRHMWACAGSQTVFDTPVVTGIESLAADVTPRGTYHIYSKQTDLTLTGSDTTGSWSDPVSYWMPFLNNQYGSYGFHDATWRPNSAFGNIDPHSMNASHGCVELPLASARWLYNWASVGMTVTIES